MKNPLIIRILFMFLVLNIWINDSSLKSHEKQERDVHFETELHIRHFLCTDYEERASALCNRCAETAWDYQQDVSNKTKEEVAMGAFFDYALFKKNVFSWYFKDLDFSQLDNKDVARQLKKLNKIGYAALRMDVFKELIKVMADMAQLYDTARICPYKSPKCNVSTQGMELSSGVTDVMANSGDYDELLYTWIAWHDATGARLKKYYEIYLVLANEGAEANNFTDRGDMWRAEYETDDLEGMVEQLWCEIEPFYLELHTYVRNCIYEAYGKDMGQEDDGYIPAHILGSLWADNWINIRGLVVPFPNETVDVTELLSKAKFTVPMMFDMVNDLTKSLGLACGKDSYNPAKGAVIEKPKGNKTVRCTPSAWDFCNGTNWKVMMCAQVSFEDLMAMYHEMGYIQYYMFYKDQPILYRSGANPAFEEAIGDMLGLSTITAPFLKKHKLLEPHFNFTNRHQLNLMMDLALQKIPLIPFAYTLDKWRWDIFADKIEPDKWNEHFWFYRMKIQRIKSPIVRSQEDFDPGGILQIATDRDYISSFLGTILEFQIHKALCNSRSVESCDDPIQPSYECDLTDNHVAGRKLRHILKMGGSKHWSFVLKDVTGQSTLSAKPLMDYFGPLYDYLKKRNQAHENQRQKR